MNDRTILIQQPSEPTSVGETVFERIGGEARVRELVDRFYDLMDLDADLADLRAVHGPSLDQARDKLFWFLCGWMGGPDHYISRFGHPRLRARHLPFSIGNAERDQWVVCMGRAMQQVGIDAGLADKLLASFYNTADWMRNRQG
ncbi:Group 2 truncated hemoglobin YjbI [Pigmentiphaga humi]|uniref:Group 2 truncated hemoglobin YjbI n=1 Tax=Pigmentiphaga humi TaxID=2478468 RepID=A0A3P4B152_9BURK|nr:group II truncated hemoglobin [Pigmentiphaga humi]VCU69772.1 Group 2 truncated hemoglobin YjbI [Pigmentiphaga humi]